MKNRIYQKPKRPNPVAREFKVEARIGQLVEETKSSTLSYASIIMAALTALVLKENKLLSDEKIQEVVTETRKLITANTSHFDSINEVIRSIIFNYGYETSAEELCNAYPELVGYLVPEDKKSKSSTVSESSENATVSE